MKLNAFLLLKKKIPAHWGTEENSEHLISTNKQLMVLNVLNQCLSNCFPNCVNHTL